jgi:uncharacterized protein YycO
VSPNKTYSAPFSFRISAISAGDIVFVYNETAHIRDKASRFITVNGQRILASVRKTDRLEPTSPIHKYSHVMLGMGGGLIIHADGQKVAIEVISDALRWQTDEALRFQIYRREDISQDIADKIVKSAVRYYSQPYQFLKYFAKSKEGDTTLFCSELIAHAYRAADVPLTSRPDNKVLPVDLYQICQSDMWRDISAEFVQEPLPLAADELIEIPGQGEIPLSDFLAHLDALPLEQARRAKQIMELQYDNMRDVLRAEVLLGEFHSLQFASAKQICLKPRTLSDKSATRIVRILEQLQALSDLSQLPSIELLVGESLLNTVEEGQTNIGLYAGFPPPLAIREMQMAREAVTIYSYLLFARIGLCTILAHYTPLEEYKHFRTAKRKYANQFFAAVPSINDLLSYENRKDLFKWVEGESDRTTCQVDFHNIIAALKVIKTLRNAGSESD